MQRSVALVVDRDPLVRSVIRDVLEPLDVTALGAGSEAEAIELLRTASVELLLIDPTAPGVRVGALLEAARRSAPASIWIAIDPGDPKPRADPRVLAGAFDTLDKPIDADRLRRVATRALQHHELLSELERLRAERQERAGYRGFVGRNELISRLRDDLRRIAASGAATWFHGEAGSGKEHGARALHVQSDCSKGPFVVVACERLDEKTWSDDEGPGLLRRAQNGFLYLEEPARMAPRLQRRFLERLRALQGDASVDGGRVRLAAGSVANPKESAARGELIEPLLRLLARESIPVPPLRERREDIPLLARHFVGRICEINRMRPVGFEPEALRALESFRWPGNVQELRDAIEHAVILAGGATIRTRHLPDTVRAPRPASSGERPAAVSSSGHFRDAKREVVERFERAYLLDLMKRHVGNVTAAAEHSGMLRSALQRLLRKHGLRSVEFRARAARPETKEGSRPDAG